ncbi:MAG: phosphoenolpyruvate-protein phosphotransferase system enzyme [Verrucomicrobiota bacterium]|jgi:phosphotransferase system enzyme I (PtsI)
MSGADATEETRFQGVGVSPGIARGVIHVVREESDEVARHRIQAADIPDEIGRFETALIQTRAQILEMQERIAESIGAKDAGIFDAHLLVVEDRTLIDEVLRKLEADLCNVEFVFQEVATHYADTLSKIDDPYLRERALDIQDVTKRVVRNLQGKAPKSFLALEVRHVLVAHNITPSDTATMNRAFVLGLATDLGSRTSHTAIMARSLGIPAVVGLHDATEKLETGQQILLDGYSGLLILNPTPETLWHYGELEHRKGQVAAQLTGLRETKSTTRDGRHIVLSANVELPEEVESAPRNGAEGIGLYRTEFLYLNRTTLPSEEEQYATYRKVAEQVQPHPLIIRTFDLGGDKVAGSMDAGDELNPFLGERAIRFCLENPEMFKAQLRAIIRASAVGNVKIMFPMISGLEELRRALACLEECKAELEREGQDFNRETEVGAMIEIPSAAISADRLAREVDFFSIGTNDLIQYAIAVDRVNERIAHLYEPTHPAVLRLLKMVADAAHAHDIWVGVCGEMAGDLALVPLLLGLGMDELSVGSSLVPRVKRAVQTLTHTECQHLVAEVMELDTSSAILARCTEMAQRNYADLLG